MESEKTVPKCPECNAEVDHLKASELRDTEYKVAYDADMTGLNYEPTEEWWGNPLGEQKDMTFFCPKCHKPIFHSGAKAEEFLSGQSTESDVKDKTLKWNENFIKEILKEVPTELISQEYHDRKMRTGGVP